MAFTAPSQASAFPAGVLADGRILFEAGFPLGSGTTPELYLVYADGSGVESYRCDHGRARWGGTQLASGDVVFTHGASLARSSTNVRWIFRLPGQTTSIDAVRLAVAGVIGPSPQLAGADAFERLTLPCWSAPSP